MILGQVQQRQKQEEDEQMESSVAQLTDKDPFNLSNDDYYVPKDVGKSARFLLTNIWSVKSKGLWKEASEEGGMDDCL